MQRRQIVKPAETALKVVDVKTAPNLNVGYIVGVGDQVPPAIEQLGAKVTFLETNDLAWGNLSKYDVIVTGVRAYERRADLRAYNRRLLDYAQAGGTAIVHIRTNSSSTLRSTARTLPASVRTGWLTRACRCGASSRLIRCSTSRNKIGSTHVGRAGAGAWSCIFLGEKDPKYVDLVSMTDSFPDNPGEKLGSLVEGKTGKGRWIYLGLGLWRQLPAGTDGAYQLLANLIALSKAPVALR